MSLTKCPACSTRLSSRATACPSCGHPLRKGTAKRVFDFVAALFIVFALVCIYGAVQSRYEQLGILGFSSAVIGVIVYLVGLAFRR